MANRSSRDPGAIQRYSAHGQIATSPDYVVPGGQAAAALEALGGSVSGRLRQMADAAVLAQVDKEGLSVGQSAGNGYLERQGAISVAEQAAGVAPRLNNAGLDQHIVAAAGRHGVSADALRVIAQIESGGDVNAKNPNSSAGGAFQFIDSTAAQYGLRNRYDPAEASDAAARLLRDNASTLARALGRAPTTAELYLAHQQGAGGATSLLTRPGARAADIVGADAVRLNGGHADMTAGEFAGLWLRKAGGTAPSVQATPELPATGGLNAQPLALRSDNTMAGRAFNAAAIRAYGWRLQHGVSTDLSNAYDQFKDDPAGFAGALRQIREQYSQDDNFGDPRVRDIFDRTFAERSETFSRSVAQRHEARLMAEQESAFGESLSAQVSALKKQAVLLGANPDAEAILGAQSARVLAEIDHALEANVITPAQAASQRSALDTTLAYARTHGVFEALPTPAAKTAFANDLLTEWANDQGPLTGLSFNQVKALSDQLAAQAQGEQNRLTAESKAELARVQGLIADDVASIAATGVGLDTAANELSPDRLAVLGIDSTAWQAQRDRALQSWQATAGMELETPAELSDRLQALMPKPGSVDFVRQSEIYQQAVKQAQDVLKERETDPLGQADRAGAIALEPIDMSTPESMAASLSLRAQQGQAVSSMFGTPASYFRPEERTQISNAMLDQPELVPGFARSLVSSFGDRAGTALGEISDAGPELAHAAGLILASDDPSVALDVARVMTGRREKTLNVKMPSDAVMATAAAAIVGPALGQNPGTRSAVLNVAGMLFEKQAAALGFDPADVKEPGSAAYEAYQHAINRALGARQLNGVQYGGLTQVNGGQVVAPTFMAADRVESILRDIRPEDLGKLPPIRSGNGVPINAGQIAGARLLPVGDGEYWVALGDPASLTPNIVQGDGGQPWVLDMATLEELSRNRPAASTFSPFSLPTFWRRGDE